MFFIYKIINTIDGLLTKIPKEMALSIKRLFGFLFVILSIVAMYLGYNWGVKNSQIPGAPLVKETNDALRLRLGQKGKDGRLRLVETPPPIVDMEQDPYTQNEKYKLRREDFIRERKTPLGENNIRDLSELNLRPLDQDGGMGMSQDNTVQRAQAPQPLSPLGLESKKSRSQKTEKKQTVKPPKNTSNKPQKSSSLDPAPYKPLDLGRHLSPGRKNKQKQKTDTDSQIKNPIQLRPLGDDVLRGN